jgi:hypothetical protein
MRNRTWALVAAILVLAGMTAAGKKKEKAALPEYVLKAQTVLVVILPDSGEPMNDASANRKAQEEVEKALMKWGRFRLALDATTADLVIGVRKGTGKAATPTVSGGPVDSRPVTLDKTDGQIRIGGSQGRPPATTVSDDPNVPGQMPPDNRPHTGMEVGAAQDTFQVYQGGVEYPLDGAPIWTQVSKSGLKPPDVTAVEEFRKALEETEKAVAQRQQNQQQQQPSQQKP